MLIVAAIFVQTITSCPVPMSYISGHDVLLCGSDRRWRSKAARTDIKLVFLKFALSFFLAGTLNFVHLRNFHVLEFRSKFVLL